MTTPTLWDAQLRLPIPPVDAVYNHTVGFWAAVVYLCFGLPVLLYALWHVRERKGQIMLLFMVGGCLCALVEPFADVLGACWHPEVEQPTVFSLLGRGIPPWVCIGYFVYFGAIAAANYLWFCYGITRKMIWIGFFTPVVVDIVMENLMLSHGLYYYYGNQPLDFIGWLPLWWPPINALGEFGGVVTVYLLMPHLKAWKLFLIPLISPTIDLVSYGLLAYPAITVVNNASLSPALTHVAGLWSWLMAVVCVYLISFVLASDSPFRKDGKLVLPLPAMGSGHA
ncbi:MAG: hypothetical protein JWQ90_835 [Hydrocarboniphaga sp.]|uniref:hypothetical protein n=1 Tax=Hydrocarboniphaga sp. TaxID=2033016 RepID=UPI002626C50D|nr:hypothetical protein [Hydrocarboniphaga sp.]MDB5968385.1 hypothetical protein [Hydrocarboniphaga sp.]